jgi:hypothetical protein
MTTSKIHTAIAKIVVAPLCKKSLKRMIENSRG